jgi:hypothetical protein|tara:strand:+ start:2105 stop:6847 length:4743 start_codon:yes stop_codon:yes gene_type:complete
MATLFNTRISDTYVGLIKTTDNAAISATLKELTDGSGNATGLFVNNAGDFRVNSVLAFGSLKDTAENIVITKFVDSADGIPNNNNDTSIPTSKAVKDFVETHVTAQDLDFRGDDATVDGDVDLDSEKFIILGTANEIETTVPSVGGNTLQIGIVTNPALSGNVGIAGNIDFADDAKARFGASQDLEIYHDGSNSYIKETGAGNLILRGGNRVNILDDAGDTMARFLKDEGNELYYNNTKRFETVTAGAKVTGNLEVTGTITGSGGSFLPLAGGTMTGSTIHNDNVKSIYGTASDGLEIYHNGNSFIDESGTGDLYLRSSDNMYFQTYGTGKAWITLTENAGVDLFFNDVKKLETTSTGVTITGRLSGLTDPTLAQDAATKKYVDDLDAASDLDFGGDSGTGDVALNTQTFSVIGTANEVETTASNQQLQIGLPSSISVNSASATALQTARDISLTGQATATISSFDGSSNVSGAVTLDNDSVTGKVLTGLASPTASNILASDSILQAFGKAQSQINTLAGGLRFMGTWNANTNTPTLQSGGGEADSGTTTGTATNKLIQSGQNFTSTVTNGDQVVNQASGATALVTNVDSNTQLTLDADIMVSGQAYTIDNSPFITQGHYFVVSVGGTQSLNGLSNWAVGDWVIAGAGNVWEKLDHTQVDGTGTAGNIAKFSSTNVIADSIMAESGSTITVTGGLTTTQNLNVGGNSSFSNKLVIDNNTEIRFKDSGGTERTTLELDSSNDLYVGTSAGGNLFLVNGSSYTTAVTIDVNQKTTFAGNVEIGKSNPELKFNNLAGGGADPILKASGTDFTISTTSLTALTVGLSTGTLSVLSNISTAGQVLCSTDTSTPTTGDAVFYKSSAGAVLSGYQTILETGSAGSRAVGLTIDNNQNATFAGTINSGSVTSTGIVKAATTFQSTAGSMTFFVPNHGQALEIAQNTGNASFTSFVGIGTSTIPNPFSGAYNNILQVGTTSGHTRLAITAGDTKSSDLTFADSNDAADAGSTIGSISYKHDSNAMLFATSGLERMRVDSSGNIQFTGATANTTVLSMNTADGSDTKQLSLAGGGADSDGRGARMRLYGNEHASTAGVVDLSTGNVAGCDMHLRAKDDMFLYTDGTARLTIDGSSGTSSFSAAVIFNDHTTHLDQVKARFGTDADATIEHNGSHLFIDNTKGTSYLRNTGANSAGIIIRNDDVGDIHIDNDFAGAVKFSTSATTRMTIDSSGGVGIGKVAAKKLDVEGAIRTINTAGTSAAELDITSGSTWTLRSNPVSGANAYGLDFIKGSAGTDKKMSILSTGDVCIGTDSPSSNTNYGTGDLNVENDTFASAQIMSHSDAVGNFSFIGLGKSSGTGASPTIVQANETVGLIGFYGYDGGAYKRIADIRSAIDGTPGSGDMPGRLEFHTSSDGTAVPAKRMVINDTGDIEVKTGSILVETAGKGIYLGGTGSANLLDDYEEGTWTPQAYYQNSTDQGNTTDNAATGTYTKVGSLVTVWISINWTITGSPVNDNVGIKNFPFRGANNLNRDSAVVIFMKNDTNPILFSVPENNTTLGLFMGSDYNGNYGNELGAGTHECRITFSYYTDQ